MLRYFFLLLFLFSCFIIRDAKAQGTPIKTINKTDKINKKDSTNIIGAINSLSDSINFLSDTTKTAVASDSTKTVAKSDVESIVEYNARDSMRFDVVKQTMFLYGEAIVTYGDIQLEAERIEVNWSKNSIKAYGIPDSTGRVVGLPIFTEKASSYNADSITYNFKSKKGIISGIVTEQEGGFIVGKKVKKAADDSFYIKDAIYTTCNLKDPHFGIRASKLKTVPGKYVVAGPFNVEINHVPTPLAFPFGFFPFSEKRSSGLIVPTYGESVARGFYLRDGGFYWAVNDYIGAKFLGQIYSQGGWGGSFEMNYKNRYHYNGNFSLSYNKVLREESDFSEAVTKDFWLRWSHSPQSKGNSRFSANVNLGTSSYNRNNSFDATNFITPSFSSNVSYSNSMKGTPFSFSATARHNQNTQTNIASIAPSVNLTMSSIKPFKKKNSSKKNLLTQLNISYTANARGNITNNPQQITTAEDVVADTLDFFSNLPTLIEKMKYGVQHKIPISTSFRLLKYVTVSPRISYTETWHQQKLSYRWDEDLKKSVTDTIKGLSRTYQYNTGASMGTQLYAFYYLKGGAIIRHQLAPSVSFSYTPDFGSEQFGFYQQNVQTDTLGNTKRISKYQGSLFGSPNSGLSKTMSFSLTNNLELKVKSKKDSVEYKKITLISNASIASSYNFAADSFQLANFSFNATSRLFKNLNISMNGTINPYPYLLVSEDKETGAIQQIRSKTLAWQQGKGIGALERLNFALSGSLAPPKTKKQEEREETIKQKAPAVAANPNQYVDFSIPWKITFNYSLNYSQTGFLEAKTTQNLGLRGELQLTKKWKISGNTSYDFEKKDFGFTSLNIFRDLHCWQMSISWVPFGPRQSYSFDLRVSSSILQDLKINKRNSWFDR